MPNENRTCPPCSGNCGQGRQCPASDARARISRDRDPEGDALSCARGVCLAVAISSVLWALLIAVMSRGAWA